MTTFQTSENPFDSFSRQPTALTEKLNVLVYIHHYSSYSLFHHLGTHGWVNTIVPHCNGMESSSIVSAYNLVVAMGLYCPTPVLLTCISQNLAYRMYTGRHVQRIWNDEYFGIMYKVH